MQMLCKVSTAFSDISCPTCGQGFLVYWTRQRAGEREEQRPALQQALRDQHTLSEAKDPHPPAFQLPEAPLAAPYHRPASLPSTLPVYS